MSLDALTRRWRRGQMLGLALRAVGMGLGASALVWASVGPVDGRSWFAVGAALASATLSFWLPRPPMADRRRLARHLDRALPELEESADLLVDDDRERSGLERLQTRRAQAAFDRGAAELPGPRAQIVSGLRFLAAGLVLASVFMGLGVLSEGGYDAAATDRAAAGGDLAALVDLASRVQIEVSPPGYTGLPAGSQDSLSFEVIEGTTVSWRLPTDIESAAWQDPLEKSLDFVSSEDGFRLEATLRESVLYRLIATQGGGPLTTPWSRIGVEPDRPPRLRFTKPQERLTTVENERIDLPLAIEVEDDFGIERLEVVTTRATGSGEMVEFREQRVPVGVDGGRTQTREIRLDLTTLGFTEGSELYFFAEAHDNRRPESNRSRTSTYILRWPAPRVRTADLEAGLPIVLPPEYFRSQRQIIIDTEALIAEQPQLDDQEFRLRSEGLGFDQRALRLRYGGLLGEEFESGRAVLAEESDHASESDHAGEADHDHAGEGHETGSPQEDEGGLAGVPEEFIHAHDSAEIATFFTSETRTQLKRVLAEMWDAEGELRSHRPEDALPFEYQALELLKDLQRRSRIFVQKVGFETPPLDPGELRLSGELADIGSRSRVVTDEPPGPLETAVESLLTALRDPSELGLAPERETLERLRSEMSVRAAEEDSAMAIFGSLDRWLTEGQLDEASREALLTALVEWVPAVERRPVGPVGETDPLGDLYRQALAEGAAD